MIKPIPKHNLEMSSIDSEMERIFREGSELESQGKLDDAAIKRIDDQMRALSERLDREAADRIAEIEERYPLPNPKLTAPANMTRPLAWLFLATTLLGLAGVMLELAIGSGFIYSHADAYRDARPMMLIVLLPACALLWFSIMKSNPYVTARYPTGVIRWGIMFPLMATAFAAMIIAAPLGWFALCGWAFGEPASNMEARVIAIDTYKGRGCKLKAKLEINGNRAEICLDGRIAGQIPKAGDIITATGNTSIFGVYLEELHPEIIGDRPRFP